MAALNITAVISKGWFWDHQVAPVNTDNVVCMWKYFDCGILLHWQVVISRGDLRKQAEKLLDDLGWSKAVLEIQYEHEVQYIHAWRLSVL